MKRLVVDLVIIALSIVCAIYIAQAGLVHTLLQSLDANIVVASFVAGLFFTSFFTTPPAIAVLGALGSEGNLAAVALVGGLGAVVGDYILFTFVRDRVAADAAVLLEGPRWRRAGHILRRRYMRRVLPVIGALIIASPLPDELGLALLGISKIKTRNFLILSYIMNTLGILGIGLIARSL
jgi:hypothetical protein